MARSSGLFLVAALAVATFAHTSGSPFLPAAYAAADPDAAKKAKDLADEAEKFFNTAGDTDLPHKERARNRKEAYVRLKEARKLLDDWLDENPEDTEKFDSLYVRIAAMMYWTKKEAAIGELTGTKPPVEQGPADSGGAKDSGGIGGTSGGGIGGTSSGGTSKPPPSSGGAGENGGDTTAPAKPPEPVVPAGPTAADGLAEVQDYESEHPSDVPGLHERYTEFLATHSDTGAPEYATALERLEVLGRKLKDVYRQVRDDDPDALEDMDNAQVRKLVGQLTQDLDSDDETVRVRAAKFMGSLGSSLAADPLLAILKHEPPSDVHDAAADALERIGGRRICNRLTRMKADDELADTIAKILGGIAGRGGAEGRIAGESLATYVADASEDLQATAIAKLAEAGKSGALGLAMLLPYAQSADKLDYIEQIGAHGEPRAASYLADFLVVNVRGVRKKQAKAAREAIEAMGKPAVRYLIPALDNDEVNVWTAELLRRITGAKLKNDKRKTWEKWFRKNRRTLEE